MRCRRNTVGQAQGDIYVNKTEIRHGTIDQMSKEEVMKALNELKQTYAPLTHDAGAEEFGNRKRARERLAEDVIDGHTETKTKPKKQREASFWQSLKKAMRDNFPDWSATFRIQSHVGCAGCPDHGQSGRLAYGRTEDHSQHERQYVPHQVAFLTKHARVVSG